MSRKLLLVNPNYENMQFGAELPLGLGYISENLITNSVEHDVLDMSLGYYDNDLELKINEYNPDLIGFSLLTFRYLKIYRLISKIKKGNPDVKIIVGGPHVTMYVNEILNQVKEIDFAIPYEAEYALLELCQDMPLQKIKGLYYRNIDGDICFTGRRPIVKDLDQIPFPKFEKFELNKYPNDHPFPILTSRGCIYQCKYCCCQIISSYRERSSENILEELLYWFKRGIKYFTFNDDNPTLNPQRLYNLCDKIEKSPLKGEISVLLNQVRPDTVNKELLSRMKDVGFDEIGFGVESGNNEVLSSLGGNKTLSSTENAIKICCEFNYLVKLYFMVGCPNENFDRFLDSVELALKYPIDLVLFFNLLPYPGTEIFKWLEDNNLLLRKPEDYLNSDDGFLWRDLPDIFETKEFTIKEKIMALKIGKVLEKSLNWKRRYRATPEHANLEFFKNLKLKHKIISRDMDQ